METVRELPDGLDRVNTAAIEVRGLKMSYGTKEVLRDVGFTVAAGEVIALLGPNGAGKTTTIEIMEGFRAPSAGHVRVLGVEPIRGDERWRARLGVVLQSWRDHGRWRVRELLHHLGRYYEPYAPQSRSPFDADELIAAVGLTEQGEQRVRQLSGGQRRRLDVAIGIVGRPEVLFLDEPTAGFDPQARRDFHDLVHRLSDLDDTTILLTTHDLDEAEKLADRILILAGGRIVADGSPDRLSREFSRDAQVRWSQGGEHFVHATDDATGFVRRLFEQHGEEVGDLEVRRATLEDTYMAIVKREEA
ncbi:ABC-2 type transport system ATP-binding protein [Nonomuraea maritima]|uniref:ABC-2 type transport system ATP-binding protein n=1 Tax=Nonomuraea maritima TaxID=683260 RepID=A0A1G9HI04_9ACTN|nr:ABC transporter ATP-binding protein [Nonomuraea maritima]SDL12547.1 ABC-2 type transport system ATP-binding protein [Nonomuraea maritima]